MISTENLHEINANDIVAYLKTITKEEKQDELVNHCKKISKRKKKLKEKKPIEQEPKEREPKEQEQQEQKDPNAVVDLQITQMRLSLSEFNERLRQKLLYHQIKLLLRQTGCRKQYRSLCGDISKIVLAAEDDFDANDLVKE